VKKTAREARYNQKETNVVAHPPITNTKSAYGGCRRDRDKKETRALGKPIAEEGVSTLCTSRNEYQLRNLNRKREKARLWRKPYNGVR